MSKSEDKDNFLKSKEDRCWMASGFLVFAALLVWHEKIPAPHFKGGPITMSESPIVFWSSIMLLLFAAAYFWFTRSKFNK